MKKVELLAPAGSLGALKAAVNCGADACYFGGQNFNARAYAKNLTDDEIKEFVKGITINMSGKGDIIGKKKMSIKLADIDNISIER